MMNKKGFYAVGVANAELDMIFFPETCAGI